MKQNENTPVCAVMGHVDHGKTSLLDKIRNSNVARGEAGGITQSVRAHQITYKSNNKDHKITFIDTPGHEAFSEMRSRGAKVADIAIIVVAGNEGAKPQTLEAIKFALGQHIPVILTITKIDMPSVDENKILAQVAQAGLLTEGNGGDAIIVRVSSKTGEGINTLLDTIILINEMIESKETQIDNSDPNLLASGLVLESHLDKRLGAVALIILKSGEIKKEDKTLYVANKLFSTKIRSLLNVDQKPHEGSAAGDPVWVIGLSEVVMIGHEISFFNNEKSAKERVLQINAEESKIVNTSNPFDLFGSQANKAENVIQIVLRADTQGSLEVAEAEILKLKEESAEIVILNKKVGEISEADAKFAKDTGAIVIGFRSKVSDKTMSYASQERVLIRNYEIIYEMIEELEGALLNLITKGEEEIEIATAAIKKVFTLSDGKNIAGSQIVKGKFIKGYKIKVVREGEEVYRGRISELRILKNEVKEVDKGQECGIMVDPNFTLLPGDSLIAYKVEKF